MRGRVEDARGGLRDRRRLLRAASFVAALAEKSIAPSRARAHRPAPQYGRLGALPIPRPRPPWAVVEESSARMIPMPRHVVE
jgi:hypothetical protein